MHRRCRRGRWLKLQSLSEPFHMPPYAKMAWQMLLLCSALGDRLDLVAPHLQLIQRQLVLLKPAKNRSWEEAFRCF